MLCNPKILYTFRMALHSWNAVSSYKEYVVIFTAIILFFYAFVNRVSIPHICHKIGQCCPCIHGIENAVLINTVL